MNKAPSPFSLGYNGHSRLYRNGTAALGIDFSSQLPAGVDELAILADSKKFQPLDWQPFTLGGTLSQYFKFSLTDILKSASEEALKKLQLSALVGGREYRSPPFDISGLIL